MTNFIFGKITGFVILCFGSVSCNKPFGQDCTLSQFETCCDGFKWNTNLGKCQKCDVGFYGQNCETACHYPWYGEDCQARCNCEIDECQFQSGCLPKYSTMADNGSGVSNITDSSTTFTSGTTLSTSAEYDKTSDTQTSTKMIPSTKLNKPEVFVLNGQILLLVGIFSFNALFVLVSIAVASYCVCRRYKNYRKRKKDNPATVIHYHEINENAVGTSRDYDPLYTTQVSEIPKDFLVDYENERPFNRERQSCQFSDLQCRSSFTTPKCLIHDREEELPSTRKSTEDKQEADFTDDGQMYLTCQN